MTSPSGTRQDSSTNPYDYQQSHTPGVYPGPNSYLGMGGVGDMMLESQEIDMSTLGGDMMPWLEYLPQDVLNYFDNTETAAQVGGMNSNVDMGMGRNNG